MTQDPAKVRNEKTTVASTNSVQPKPSMFKLNDVDNGYLVIANVRTQQYKKEYF